MIKIIRYGDFAPFYELSRFSRFLLLKFEILGFTSFATSGWVFGVRPAIFRVLDVFSIYI